MPSRESFATSVRNKCHRLEEERISAFVDGNAEDRKQREEIIP